MNVIRYPVNWLSAFINLVVLGKMLPDAQATKSNAKQQTAQPEKEVNEHAYKLINELCNDETGEITKYDAQMVEFVNKAAKRNPFTIKN